MVWASGAPGCLSPCRSVGRSAGGCWSRSIIFHVAPWVSASSRSDPTAARCARAWDRLLHRLGTTPKYIVCDRDSVFDCEAFRRWVKRKGIQPPRYGAVGKHGSIAVVERFILTLKQLLRQLPLIPLRRESFRRELVAVTQWYNEYRPHATLGGQTPNEVYGRRFPANRKPRIEPRLTLAARLALCQTVGTGSRQARTAFRRPPSPSTRTAVTCRS